MEMLDSADFRKLLNDRLRACLFSPNLTAYVTDLGDHIFEFLEKNPNVFKFKQEFLHDPKIFTDIGKRKHKTKAKDQHPEETGNCHFDKSTHSAGNDGDNYGAPGEDCLLRLLHHKAPTKTLPMTMKKPVVTMLLGGVQEHGKKGTSSTEEWEDNVKDDFTLVTTSSLKLSKSTWQPMLSQGDWSLRLTHHLFSGAASNTADAFSIPSYGKAEWTPPTCSEFIQPKQIETRPLNRLETDRVNRGAQANLQEQRIQAQLNTERQQPSLTVNKFHWYSKLQILPARHKFWNLAQMQREKIYWIYPRLSQFSRLLPLWVHQGQHSCPTITSPVTLDNPKFMSEPAHIPQTAVNSTQYDSVNLTGIIPTSGFHPNLFDEVIQNLCNCCNKEQVQIIAENVFGIGFILPHEYTQLLAESLLDANDFCPTNPKLALQDPPSANKHQNLAQDLAQHCHRTFTWKYWTPFAISSKILLPQLPTITPATSPGSASPTTAQATQLNKWQAILDWDLGNWYEGILVNPHETIQSLVIFRDVSPGWYIVQVTAVKFVNLRLTYYRNGSINLETNNSHQLLQWDPNIGYGIFHQRTNAPELSDAPSCTCANDRDYYQMFLNQKSTQFMEWHEEAGDWLPLHHVTKKTVANLSAMHYILRSTQMILKDPFFSIFLPIEVLKDVGILVGTF
ncbi:hypothetical protein SERLADRAFT_404742 [Serpula lacrymans var. lacrymans S7.9]|uniref:Uncharacterized protein n=1 Tax=Serpula lacrymans var. lacrymans (strain S7.9) TaxID=578457 RepID=F8NEP0_SERL9|nr:uncharacterized protein SERLADRAFT_404742 [Serpula lacrymans var. lacrymans S7.9]EGO30674.1 hypothetical protein SERLADRAFT_404742 [Serpula lacrymans var. lacrymans S7.9]